MAGTVADMAQIVMREYTAAMRRRGLRRSTIDKRSALTRSWLRRVDYTTAGRADVEQFVDDRGGGAQYRYNTISHLHAFYVWGQRVGRVGHDPTVNVERPRLPHRLPRPARGDMVALAIEAAKPETAVMVALMADAGLRCCEVAALRWEHVDLSARFLLVIDGKGGRDRKVGLPARLVRVLARLDAVDGPVVGRRLTAHNVSRIVCSYLRGAGVNATAHQLRHLYATRLYSATSGDLLAVQRALGHSSVATTQIYAEIDTARVVAAAALLDAA